MTLGPQAALLRRALGPRAAAAIVVGCMIGTGVFLKAAVMAQETGSPLVLLAVWVCAGLLTLAGALSYAELGGLLPYAGGEYVYLREAYGDLPAFLLGWMRFWIAQPGSVAAYAVGAAIFLRDAWPGLPLGTGPIAVAFIATFTAVNCLPVREGGRVQTALTALKIAIIAAIALGALLLARGGSWAHLAESAPALGPGASGGSAVGGIGGFSAAMLAALWAYDGWANVSMLGGEVERPGRNVPLALVGGTAVVMGLYLLIHLGYLYALPFREIVTSSSRAYPDAPPVAARALATFLGHGARRVLSAVFVISALGAMNGSIAAGARVPYAMARDGLFFRFLARIEARTGVPARAVLVQGAIGAALALSGSFDELTDYVIFASWLFYAWVTSCVFVLRRKLPDAPRPFRMPGYPWLPAAFVALSLALTAQSLVSGFRAALIGAGLIALGVPAFFCFRALRRP